MGPRAHSRYPTVLELPRKCSVPAERLFAGNTRGHIIGFGCLLCPPPQPGAKTTSPVTDHQVQLPQDARILALRCVDTSFPFLIKLLTKLKCQPLPVIPTLSKIRRLEPPLS